MQREISNKVFLENIVSLYEDAGRLSATDRKASNYNDAKEKVKKIRELINTGRYDEDIAKYIPGLLELKFQGMREDIDTKERVAHSSYTDIEQFDFQILLTDNYYINPSSIHICFPIKIKTKTNQALDIDADLITVNNFFAHFVKEISMTKYGSNKELIFGITKPCTYLHPASSTSTQLISTSTQLHLPPLSSFKPPPSPLQHPQRYKNQNIASNWAISPNLRRKFKVLRFA